MAAATVLSFLAPDAADFQRPGLARIVFFHLPCALGSTAFLSLSAWFALRYLLSRSGHWDARSAAAMEMGFLLGLLALATGIVFAKVQWGAWWNWDPRQTSFLLVMLMVGAYFALRSAFADGAKRAAVSSAYVLASLLPIVFLVFVYPRLAQVTTLHPDVVRQGGLDSTYRSVFLAVFGLLLAACGWIYRLRVRAWVLESELEVIRAGLADRDRPAAAGVVRAVSVPDERG